MNASESCEVRTAADPGFELDIARFRFRLEALEPLILPRENKGNVLRGAFGTIFKRICCGSICTRCAESPLRTHCAYAAIFEPSPPPGSERLRNLQDIPRPFVFRPPTDGKGRYERGEIFEFELLLFGSAVEYLAYFIVAFRELGESGFGVGRGRCRLKLVCAQAEDGREQEIYSHETQCVRPLSTVLRASALMNAPARTSKIRIDYLTPTEIKYEGLAIRSPDFHHLVKRLRDRINAIGWFYQGRLLHMDYAAFGKRAEGIQTVKSNIVWTDRERLSSRTHNRHPIGGFVGHAEYAGDLSEFIPLLRVGQFTHAGKHAVWGNGRFEFQLMDLDETKGV
jgi:CRISPR-associated endoribonuclease Cas6